MDGCGCGFIEENKKYGRICDSSIILLGYILRELILDLIAASLGLILDLISLIIDLI